MATRTFTFQAKPTNGTVELMDTEVLHYGGLRKPSEQAGSFDKGVAKLMRSVKAVGILEPLSIVERTGARNLGSYKVMSGDRRLSVVRDLQAQWAKGKHEAQEISPWLTIPCIKYDAAAWEIEAIMLEANDMRQPMTRQEKRMAAQALLKRAGTTEDGPKNLARAIGYTPGGLTVMAAEPTPRLTADQAAKPVADRSFNIAVGVDQALAFLNDQTAQFNLDALASGMAEGASITVTTTVFTGKISSIEADDGVFIVTVEPDEDPDDEPDVTDPEAQPNDGGE